MWLVLLCSASAVGDVDAGAVVYAARCAQCHGSEGLADGPAAPFVLPRPRVLADNFSFKIRTTPSGELPTDEDLVRVVARGLPGTSMPPFESALSEQDILDVVTYIKALSPDFSDPVYVEAIVPMPELAEDPPPSTPEAVARGRELYVENECFKCHGDRGRGDGPSWEDLEDDWDDPILPANFANPEHFRGGASAADVFRTISTGLNGTPMPSYADSLGPEQRWDLAHYIVSLAPGELEDETVRALAVEELPEDWSAVPVTRIPLVANVIERPRLYFQAVGFVYVQAVYTEEELAMRLQWDDRTASTGTDAVGDYADRDGSIHRATDHPDQLAVQLPAKPDDRARPHLLLGDARKAVRLWWWRSDEGLSTRTGKGHDKLTEGPDSGLEGHATWEDGRYTLMLTHPLDEDLGIAPGAWVPLALSAWDGDLGEVGTRRGLSSWRWLFLEPELPQRAYAAPPVGFLLALGLLGFVVRATRRAAGSEA